MEIPFSREIAAGYSRGVLPVRDSQEWQERFLNLFSQVKGALHQ
jgi:hypothetical protein